MCVCVCVQLAPGVDPKTVVCEYFKQGICAKVPVWSCTPMRVWTSMCVCVCGCVSRKVLTCVCVWAYCVCVSAVYLSVVVLAWRAGLLCMCECACAIPAFTCACACVWYLLQGKKCKFAHDLTVSGKGRLDLTRDLRDVRAEEEGGDGMQGGEYTHTVHGMHMGVAVTLCEHGRVC